MVRSGSRSHGRSGGDQVTEVGLTHPEEGIGYYTIDQFDRLRNAVNTARTLVPWLRVAGYIRGQQGERVHSSRDGHIGIPPTWLAAEEISRLLGELNQWKELHDVVNDEHGAWLGWEFVRETETANARWPIEDRPHRVQQMRCDKCQALTLRYHPPRHAEDRIIVRCSDKTCRAVMDEAMFAFATHVIEQENHEREKQRLDQARRRRSARRQGQADDLPVGA